MHAWACKVHQNTRTPHGEPRGAPGCTREPRAMRGTCRGGHARMNSEKKEGVGGRNHAVMNPGVGGGGLVTGETWDPIAEPRRRIAEGTGQRDGRRREGNDREEIAGGDGSGGGEYGEASS